MQNHDWIELFRTIPENQHNVLVLTTLSGMDLSIETIVRTELTYMVFRGRVCGQTDDGRLFFLPYRQIDYLQVNRVVKEADIKDILGDKTEPAPKSGLLIGGASSPGLVASPPKSSPSSLPGVAPASSPRLTPASPNAPAVVGAPRAPAGRPAMAPTLASRMANVPAAALQAQRHPSVPAAALVPPPSLVGNGAEGAAPAPPRNSILERLRAQRNAVLPPRPPGR